MSTEKMKIGEVRQINEDYLVEAYVLSSIAGGVQRHVRVYERNEEDGRFNSVLDVSYEKAQEIANGIALAAEPLHEDDRPKAKP